MKTLSVRQPWAWLIVHGYKNIENRSWRTSHRGEILIHASKTLDPQFDQIQRRLQLQQCGINVPDTEKLQFGGVIGIATITDCVSESRSDWFVGKIGWLLSDARTLPYYPCRGKPGVFDVEYPHSTAKQRRGGQRAGAGRTPRYGQRMRSISLRLPEKYIVTLRDLGDGNVSAGVRRLYELKFRM